MSNRRTLRNRRIASLRLIDRMGAEVSGYSSVSSSDSDSNSSGPSVDNLEASSYSSFFGSLLHSTRNRITHTFGNRRTGRGPSCRNPNLFGDISQPRRPGTPFISLETSSSSSSSSSSSDSDTSTSDSTMSNRSTRSSGGLRNAGNPVDRVMPVNTAGRGTSRPRSTAVPRTSAVRGRRSIRGASAARGRPSTSAARTAAAAAIETANIHRENGPVPSTSRGNNLEILAQPADNRLDHSINSITFECIICLENLDCEASMNEVSLNNTVTLPAEVAQLAPLELPVAGRGRGTGRGGARSRRTPAVCDPSEVVATPCGHMYHRYCIEKWFFEQGRKTCPSCRKNVPGKLIRLYPNVGQSTRYVGGGRQNNLTPASTNPVPIPQNPLNQPAAAPVILVPVVSPQVQPNNQIGIPDVRVVPNTQCVNAACADLKMMHELLVTDYNQLRERHLNVTEERDMQQAQILSLEDATRKLTEEVIELREDAGDSAAKRRRQC